MSSHIKLLLAPPKKGKLVLSSKSEYQNRVKIRIKVWEQKEIAHIKKTRILPWELAFLVPFIRCLSFPEIKVWRG